jgi:hypothetical protein
MVPRRKTRVVPPPPVCPLTTCMRVLGGAWTPNVLWYLRETPRRFRTEERPLRRLGQDAQRATPEARARRRRPPRGETDVAPDGRVPTDVARRTVDSGDRGDRGRRPRVEAAEGRALGAWVGRPYAAAPRTGCAAARTCRRSSQDAVTRRRKDSMPSHTAALRMSRQPLRLVPPANVPPRGCWMGSHPR